MAIGGLGVVVHETEDDGDGQAKSVGASDRVFECVVPFSALALLNPIQNKPAGFPGGFVVEFMNARRMNHFFMP